MNLIYDGSFEGFVTAFIKASQLKEEFITISKEEKLDINVRVDSEKNLQIMDKELLKNLKILYLSETEDFENSAVDAFIKNKKEKFYQIKSAFMKELSSFKRFTRFKKINGIYTAVIEPACNIVEMLGDYFFKKMDNEFLIYDKKRKNIYIKKNDRKIIKKNFNLDLSSTTDEFEILWKIFHSSISIKERENPKLQKSKIPIKYRKHMTEFLI